MSVSISIFDKGLVEALARLKNVPISKVIRNAARDFAKRAQQVTPNAKISKSQFFTFIDWKTGKRRYLHESQVMTERTRKGTLRMAKKWKNFNPARGFTWMTQFKLKRVRIAKGFSKATWNNVFRLLGIPPKPRPNKISEKAESLSQLQAQSTQGKAEMIITDYIHFDKWGINHDGATVKHIIEEGFKPALKNIVKEVKKGLRQLWK